VYLARTYSKYMEHAYHEFNLHGLVVTTYNGGKVLNIYASGSNSTWIIDYGATDHMIFDPRYFTTLNLPT